MASQKRLTPDGGQYTPNKRGLKVLESKQSYKKMFYGNDSARSKEKRHLVTSKSIKNQNKRKRHPYLSQIDPFEKLCSKIKKSTSKAKRQSKNFSPDCHILKF